jgi:bacillithiol system protein YtxJ
MNPLENTEEFDRILAEPLAIIFKHSTLCGLSAQAHDQTERFLAEHPDRAIYKVDVIESRPVSDYIEAKTGVRHASPQLLVLRDGEVVWHDSHGGVTAEAIATALG